MRVKVMTILFAATFLLSACSEGEEILQKINQLLDQQLNNTTETIEEPAEDESTRDEAQSSEAADSNQLVESEQEIQPTDDAEGVEAESAPTTNGEMTFEEKLAFHGHEAIAGPNGGVVPYPEDWVLIYEKDQDPVWEGVYCFSVEPESGMKQLEANLHLAGFTSDGKPSEIEVALYELNYEIEEGSYYVEGQAVFYQEKSGLSCVDVYFQIDSN